ncbi:MAG TPA: hypothetical protein VE400_05645 [Mycobacterium sp.]|jgi:hypothetical protein|nr:hypothetical protein [Mycobacterium sp.]
MTEPDRDPSNRTRELESVVDDLEDKVANEREAEGIPGNAGDRKNAVTRGSVNSEDEPPD